MIQPLNENLSAYQARNRLACGFGRYMKIINRYTVCSDGQIRGVEYPATWDIKLLRPDGWSIV